MSTTRISEYQARITRDDNNAWLNSLFCRAIDGEVLTVGEQYIYLTGPGMSCHVSARVATQTELDRVAAGVARWIAAGKPEVRR